MLSLSQQTFVPSNVQTRFANDRLNRQSSIGLSSSVEAASTIRAPFGGLHLKVSQTRTEREQAFQLVHRVYSRSGLTDENSTGMRVLRQHLASTTDVIVAKQNGKTVYTVSLVGDNEEYGLPLESLFEQEVNEMRDAGLRLAEISCLATDWDAGDKRGRFETFVKVIGLLLQTARYRGIDRLLLAVHPRHAKVYERMFGCVRCTEAREYASVKGNPAILCTHDFAALDRTGFPLFDQLYAHRYSSSQMEGKPMSEAEKVYFEQFLPAGEYEVEPMAA